MSIRGVAFKVLAVGALGCALSGVAHTQETANTAKSFWDDFDRTAAGCSAQVALEQNPYIAYIMRIKGKANNFWREPEFLTNVVPDLTQRWLDRVRDGTPLPNIGDKAPDEIRPDQIAALEIYNEAVLNAREFPVEFFEKSAEDQPHVQFANLWNHPDTYRGKVIKIEGRLVRLLKIDKVSSELEARGVTHLYEGWIFGPTPKSIPYCVIFPNEAVDPRDPSKRLKPAEKMERHVTFTGYFIKKYRYRAGDGKDLDAPLLIGNTVRVQAKSAKDNNPPSITTSLIDGTVLYAIGGFLLGVIVLLVGLNWYFRRGDKVFQDRLTKLHLQQAQEMVTREEESPTQDDLEVKKES